MKVRGSGGMWVIDLPPPLFSGNERVRLVAHTAVYEVMLCVDVRETRSTGCGGWVEGLPRYRKIEYAKFTVAEDDKSYPDVLGFREGRELDFFLRRGELDEWDYICGGLVQYVRKRNDEQKARWVDVFVKYGRYLRGVQSPELSKFKGSPCRGAGPTGGPGGDDTGGDHAGGHTGGVIGVPTDLTGTGPQLDQQKQLLQSQGSQQHDSGQQPTQ